MSNPRPLTLTTTASDHVSAALRHVRDAEHLLDYSAGHTSPDQAYHLAGFGPECARKATIADNWLDKVIGHGATVWADDMLDFAVSLDPVAHRYDITDFHRRFPELAKWNSQSRYCKTGTFTQQAAQICSEARKVVDAIVLDLWADGRLEDREAFQ